MKAHQLNIIEAQIGNTEITNFDEIRRNNDNLFFNGEMDFWQRGDGPYTTNAYTADRWTRISSGGTVTAQKHVNTSWPSQRSTQRSLQLTVASQSAAGDYAQISQRVERWQDVSGKTVTLSADIFAGQSSTSVAFKFLNYYGVGGDATTTTTPNDKVALDYGWNHVAVTIDVPTYFGKVLGTAPYFEPYFIFSAGSNYDTLTHNLGIQSGVWYVTNAKLELGDTATPFISRPEAEEFILCNRYYEIWAAGYQPAVMTTSAAGYFDIRYKVQKRANPTATEVGTAQIYQPGPGWSNRTDISFASMNFREGIGLIYDTAHTYSIAGAYLLNIIVHLNAEL